MLREFYFDLWKQKLTEASADVDSKLGTYYCVNYLMEAYTNVKNITENERILITRFRTGSHSLAIEIGRFSNIPRANRLCICGGGVQTMWHIFAECQWTRFIVNKEYRNLKEVFQDENLLNLIFKITKKLNISTF